MKHGARLGRRLRARLRYYARVVPAYVMRRESHLTFWHESPEISPGFVPGKISPYPMAFATKADYRGPRDPLGLPLLDYHGRIGLQHNPIAIAQFGLGNYNRLGSDDDADRRRSFLGAADWLVEHLERDAAGLWVWNHHFDWEYRVRLRAPWRSGLAQGQGISLLVRAHDETGSPHYLEAAERAFESLLTPVDRGGVIATDQNGFTWIEEYIVSPPTHVLNGFIWALWGVQDYFRVTGEPRSGELLEKCLSTLAENLPRYDAGYWSRYELSGTRLGMLASPFYHRLHIVQLRILHRLRAEEAFTRYASLWEAQLNRRLCKARAIAHKAVFKLLYY